MTRPRAAFARPGPQPATDDTAMAQPVNFTVRDGFSYTDTGGEFPRRYVAGETVRLDPAIGEAAHQLERTNPPAPARSLAQSVEQAVESAVDRVLGIDPAPSDTAAQGQMP